MCGIDVTRAQTENRVGWNREMGKGRVHDAQCVRTGTVVDVANGGSGIEWVTRSGDGGRDERRVVQGKSRWLAETYSRDGGRKVQQWMP